MKQEIQHLDRSSQAYLEFEEFEGSEETPVYQRRSHLDCSNVPVASANPNEQIGIPARVVPEE
ncbi:MAG: hypothetical protein ABSC49_02490 [Candidatus Microgenomates bacterium]|jgi:hypothetical protein